MFNPKQYWVPRCTLYDAVDPVQLHSCPAKCEHMRTLMVVDVAGSGSQQVRVCCYPSSYCVFRKVDGGGLVMEVGDVTV